MRDNSSDNELIIKRRKRKFRKKCIMLFIMLVAILITLCIELPYFGIKNIVVTNNKDITSESIIKLSNIAKGNNIFCINIKKIKNNILENPYIADVRVTRKLPDTMILKISERTAIFYSELNGKKILMDKCGTILQISDNMNVSNYVKLQGIDMKNIEVGKNISSEDDKRTKIISTIGDLIMRSNTAVPKMSIIDVSDTVNIKVYYGNMCVMLGDSSDIENKLNKSINILSSQKNLGTAKGYIDVSFNGNPVIYVGK